jgi:hypothetical protein
MDAVPLVETPETLTVAFADSAEPEALAALGFAARRRIVALVATESDIERALDRLYGDGRALRCETHPRIVPPLGVVMGRAAGGRSES